MRVSTLFLAFFCVLSASVAAQKSLPPQGAHAAQQAAFSHPEFKQEQDYDRAQGIVHRNPNIFSKNCILQKQVYGWHPAWSGTAYQQYDYALLSTVAYYSYEVNPATGAPKTIHQWRETQMVQMAHDAGSQVELTASLFGKDIAVFLKNPKACTMLCDSILTLLQFKDADGVCLDFEGLQPAQSGAYVKFVEQLAGTLRAWRKEATVTLTLPAHDALHAYDIAALSKTVTRFVVMAYDFRGPDAETAGPVAPLHGSTLWGEDGMSYCLRQYIDAGAPKNKLLAGVPYYGYRWPTASLQVPSKTTGPGKLVLLRDYEAMDSSAFLNWDSSSVTGWIPSAKGQPDAQLWIDQVSSLTEKFQSIRNLGIAGAGIWALGYDHGNGKYWNLIKGEFGNCPVGDELVDNMDTRHPALRGQTSAERNTWNWVWMLGGGAVAIAIIWLVKKYL